MIRISLVLLFALLFSASPAPGRPLADSQVSGWGITTATATWIGPTGWTVLTPHNANARHNWPPAAPWEPGQGNLGMGGGFTLPHMRHDPNRSVRPVFGAYLTDRNQAVWRLGTAVPVQQLQWALPNSRFAFFAVAERHVIGVNVAWNTPRTVPGHPRIDFRTPLAFPGIDASMDPVLVRFGPADQQGYVGRERRFVWAVRGDDGIIRTTTLLQWVNNSVWQSESSGAIARRVETTGTTGQQFIVSYGQNEFFAEQRADGSFNWDPFPHRGDAPAHSRGWHYTAMIATNSVAVSEMFTFTQGLSLSDLEAGRIVPFMTAGMVLPPGSIAPVPVSDVDRTGDGWSRVITGWMDRFSGIFGFLRVLDPENRL